MTRKGKIARLPRHIRHELNRRLDDGEQGKDLVQWLNRLEPVKKMLATDFEGRPVNEQNLTEWKQGGFLDWQRQQEACERVRSLVELSDDLDDATNEQTIADRLAVALAAELAAEAQARLEQTSDPAERWRYLCEALRHLSDLRQGDHDAARAAIEKERLSFESARFEREEKNIALAEVKRNLKAPVIAAFCRPAMVKAMGGGEVAEKLVDFINYVNHNIKLPMSSWSFTDAADDDPPPF